MSEQLFLADTLTISTKRGPNGLVSTVHAAGRPLKTTQELLTAALAVAAGTDLTEEQRQCLVDAKLLRPINPFGGPIPETLALRSDVTLRLNLINARVNLPGLAGQRITPYQHFYRSVCVPPIRLAPLMAFHKKVLTLWHHLITEPNAATLLGTAAQEIWESDFALQSSVLDTGEPGHPHFVPLVPLPQQSPQFDLRGLTIQLQADEPLEISVDTWENLPETLRPLRHLAAGTKGQDLKKVTPRSMVHYIREWLSENIMFEPPEVEFKLNSGYVAHLGHGTLLGCLADKRFLVDPWIPRTPSGPGVIPLPRFAFPPLDALFLTRLALDAADIETLLLLPEDTPIYVPKQPGTAMLRAMGFTHITEVAIGEVVSIGDLTATSIPVMEPLSTGWLLHDSERGLLALGQETQPVLEDIPSQVTPVFACRVTNSAPRITNGWPTILEPSGDWFKPLRPALDFEAIAQQVGPAEVALYFEGGAHWYVPRTAGMRNRITGGEGPMFTLLPEVKDIEAQANCAVRVSAPYDVYAIGQGFERSVAQAFTRTPPAPKEEA